MTKAAIVCWYRYTPRSDDHYKTQWDLFYKYAKNWYKHLDAFYIVDAGWNIPKEQLHPNTTIITEDYRSHWWYMNNLIELVKEDAFMLIDPDILIYNDRVVKHGFDALEDYDICGILDNSGSKNLFPANKDRDTRRRYTPYLTFANTPDFKGRDFTPTQRNGLFEFDSMGEITNDLYMSLKLKELPDDRSTVYLNEDLSVSKEINLDSPNFNWSKKKLELGYYHVRNSSVGLSLLVEYEYDRPAYDRRKSIMPFREAARLLAWQWIYDKHSGKLEEWRHTYLPVLEDYGISMDTWLNYISEFEGYYKWLK